MLYKILTLFTTKQVTENAILDLQNVKCEKSYVI